MATAGGTAMAEEMQQNGLEFLLDPVDRFPLREVTADVEQPDPSVLLDVRWPNLPAADSSCEAVAGKLGLRTGRAPPDRAPCVGTVTPLEETIRKYADKPSDNVVKPELGMSFDSLGAEAYDFYNLYSWELGFGIRYGKSRLNVERTKCMQEIVCGCSGKPKQQNSRSCRCECPAMIRLLRAEDNGWYIAEHRSSHNHSLSLTYGEKVCWPSHKHIDV